MAKVETLISECDRCGKEARTPTSSFKKGEAIIPNGWINVSIKTRTADLETMDLCDECGIPVLRAIR